MSTTTTKPTNDWSLMPRGTVSGVALSAAYITAGTGIADVFHVNPAIVAITAGVGAVGNVVVGAYHNDGPSPILYRLACWAGAGSWVTWNLAEAHHHWLTTNSLSTLAGGAIVAGVFARFGRRSEDGNAPRGMLIMRSAARTSNEWEERIRRVCRINVTVDNVQPWPTGAGYDVLGENPSGGATLRDLQGAVDKLAADADLPDGCGVEFEGRGSRRKWVAHVATVNRLLETIDYPEDYSRQSITDPIELGEYRDSKAVGVEMREKSAVVTGQKGSGKTNVLDCYTLGFGRCDDALPWHVDMNGGGMSQAWLHPWLNGETERPAIDWAAPTPLEALYLTTVHLAIMKHRKSAYRSYRVKSDSKLLPLSRDLPAIPLMLDEGAEVLGSPTDPILRKVRDNVEEIQRISRNEGGTTVVSGLRCTADVMAPAILKQAAIRIGMLVTDDNELDYMYGYHKGTSAADLPGPGAGYVTSDAANPRVWKSYFLRPSQIVRAAVEIANRRPELDAASLEIADGEFEFDLGGRQPVKKSGLYSGRYERMRAYFGGESAGEQGAELAVPDPAEVVPVAAAPAQAAWSDFGSFTGGGRDMSDAASWPALSVVPPLESEPQPAELAAVPVQSIPQILTRALAAFDAAADDRMHSETLAQALGFGSTNEMAELLRPLEVRPLASWFMRNGEKARGYARESLIEAAERVARGELEVPDVVAEWPAA